ncbi:MAG: hypothetical protein C5B49_16650 [Bdellovibrio sp.]|nr:MAG: hypothetical protein C5B49_16650 [Bdellovibrio sp.]
MPAPLGLARTVRTTGIRAGIRTGTTALVSMIRAMATAMMLAITVTPMDIKSGMTTITVTVERDAVDTQVNVEAPTKLAFAFAAITPVSNRLLNLMTMIVEPRHA